MVKNNVVAERSTPFKQPTSEAAYLPEGGRWLSAAKLVLCCNQHTLPFAQMQMLFARKWQVFTFGYKG